MNKSRHAGIRQQQRGISSLVVDLLLQFGRSECAGDGTRKVFLDKAARRRLSSYAGPLASQLNAYLDAYLVVDRDQHVVTVGHRLERVMREATERAREARLRGARHSH